MNEIVPFEQRIGALTAGDVRSQVNLIQSVMAEVMKKDEHYGVIPGTGSKPSLLKAGAEKLCLVFRLAPDYDIQEMREGQHVTITSKCFLTHIPSGQRYGAGMGSCSTRESKYAYRQGGVKCPSCGKEAIIKGKDFKNDGLPTGWICFAKKGGCGTKFKDGDTAIESQPRGRMPNEDLADQYNTVLKMANKRSLVAAVLNTTAASDIFTQDIEDMPHLQAEIVKDEDRKQTDDRPKVDPAQIDAIHTSLSKNNVELAALLAKAELTDLAEMAAEDAPKAIKWIDSQGKKK